MTVILMCFIVCYFITSLKTKIYLHRLSNMIKWWEYTFLGEIIKLGKVTISFVMSIYPSVRMKQLDFH
jgi:hypothetical protein